MKITRLIGGGESWYYLVSQDGKVLAASHQDDPSGMSRLRSMLISGKNSNPAPYYLS